jgi:phage I-like protein
MVMNRGHQLTSAMLAASVGAAVLVAASNDAPVLIAASSEVALVDGAPARRVKLLPIGQIAMRDGRGPYYLRDRVHAEAVVAATREWLGGGDFMFDYDHQAVAASRIDGSTSRASAWVKPEKLIVLDDGIYADDVEWTAAADAALRGREYRYVSPTFMAARGTGDVLQLKNTALTNSPAIDLPAIAASHTGDQSTMDKDAILALLGLAANATGEQIAAAVNGLGKAQAPATSAIAIAAGIAESATVEEITAAVAGLKKAGAPDPAKFVPVEQVTAMSEQIKVLLGERAEEIVASAIASGQVVPALKGWALDYFRKDEAGFRTWLENQPAVVTAGQQLGGRKPTEKATSLSADEIASCAAIGMSHEDFLKAKNEEIA